MEALSPEHLRFTSYTQHVAHVLKNILSPHERQKGVNVKISWLPQSTFDVPGRLGLTSIPGGEASLTEDLDALEAQGVTDIVCLVEEVELEWMDPPETMLQRQLSVERKGMSFYNYPIEDYEAPDLYEAKQIVQLIMEALEKGRSVIVHCWAGLGRAGTIAACVCVSQGMMPLQAIQHVRWIRPGAIQSEQQEALIKAFSLNV